MIFGFTPLSDPNGKSTPPGRLPGSEPAWDHVHTRIWSDGSRSSLLFGKRLVSIDADHSEHRENLGYSLGRTRGRKIEPPQPRDSCLTEERFRRGSR